MKKTLLVLAISTAISTAAFAQITLGASAVQYYPEVDGKLPTFKQAWEDFRDGSQVYWGGFGEIILGKLGLGLSFNQQSYDNPWYYEHYDVDTKGTFEQWNYDVNLYLAYHLFGGRAFIDPFIQAGFGMMAFDWKNKEALSGRIETSDDPIRASTYYDIGAGLGINLGGLGVFVKAMWNMPTGEPVTSSSYDADDLPPWPILPFKWVFGAKLIL